MKTLVVSDDLDEDKVELMAIATAHIGRFDPDTLDLIAHANRHQLYRRFEAMERFNINRPF